MADPVNPLDFEEIISYAIGDLEANIDKERQEQLKERFGEYKVLFDCSPYTSQGTIDTLNKKFGRDKYGFIQESDNKELLNEFAKLWFLKGEIERVNNRIHKLTPNQ